MPSGRTRSASRYITLPDMGAGACGRNTASQSFSTRILQIDWAGRPEGHGNAGQTADSFFHPSDPSEFGYLLRPKSLIQLSKLTRGAGRTPFHRGNPGLYAVEGPPRRHNAGLLRTARSGRVVLE